MSAEPTEESVLVEALQRLARGEQASLGGLLQTVGETRVLEDTLVSCRTHFVCRDGNGRVRVTALAEALALRIVDCCIPRSRARRADEHLAQTGSTAIHHAREVR